ncbi:alpha/beta fold hydrolase [Caldimonas brevitalea]|uniref:Alpha/beta hydrolase n=1 Tax=Caldimonas brevitalea TaxID=413882 RepID=A0A0G3BUZ2_9BURK|nr:alpha/beta fold hydrolase [Caldimonas brevitalea]AKJ31211.1 alpha/beta hydrolase [Caldimonas brevitalea]
MTSPAIETYFADLPHGIRLSCRACGPRDAPVLVFLHGFPEAAFIWDDVMLSLADRWRCVAPNLRGYEASSKPTEVEAYRAKHLVQDLVALIESLGAPVAGLVAHDWGGAVAWNLAVQQPQLIGRLAILNSPHPATFLRELQRNPAQQESSAYMNFLCRPDAETLLAADDYAKLWPFFANMGVVQDWLTDAVKAQYRAVWDAGLTGPLNYYRASPLRPPTEADRAALKIEFQPEQVTVRVPTLVLWGENDVALPVGLLDGLEAYVPQMTLRRVPGASHWIVHEEPELVSAALREHFSAAGPVPG